MNSPDASQQSQQQPNQQRDPHPAEMPPAKRKDEGKDAPPTSGQKDSKPWPPDSIPNPMPGVDPQQTPGID